MRKLLTAGIFGTILGIVGAGTVNASIVSSGFLDEKLTEYALSTSLDLKANQSDFTELNTQISNSVDNLKSLWDADIGMLADSFNPNKVNNDINGAFDLVGGFILYSMESLTRGWTSSGIGVRLENYYGYNPGLEGMFNGWTIYDPSGSETMVYKGLEYISSQFRTVEDAYHISLAKLLLNGDTKVILDDYNYTGPVYPIWKLSEGIDKIGTLPDDITVSEMLTSTWTTDGTTYPGLSLISDYIHRIELAYNTRFLSIFLDGGPSTTIDGVDYTGPVYPLWKLSEGIDKIDSIETKIGTLPDGITVQAMYDGWTDAGYNFPGLYEIASDTMKFKSAFPNVSIGMLLALGLKEYTYNNYTGPIYPLWKLSEGIDKIDFIETKIGDLPTEIPNMDVTWERYGFAESGTPIDLPDTIGGMFAMLFNEDESYNGLSLRNIMVRILMGFSNSRNPDLRIEGLANLTSAYKLVGDSPIVTAVNANTAKIGTVPDGKNLAGMIGTLPDGYDSVGAALTAIKGIAEDAKAAALAAIPDPKQEGSSGKFVLTVDIVGDNATYRWEKIDREGETTTTTTE